MEAFEAGHGGPLLTLAALSAALPLRWAVSLGWIQRVALGVPL